MIEAEKGTDPSGPTKANPSDGVESHWFRDVALVTAIATIVVMSATMARPMVTYRAIGLEASPLEIGLVQAVYSLLPMLTAIGLGRWVDRVGEARIIAVGCVTMVAGAVVLAVAPSLIALAIGQVSMGFGVIATAIATQSFIANRGPAERQVHLFGWFSVAISLGQIVGPALAALLVSSQESGTPVITQGHSLEALVFLVAAAAAFVGLLLVQTLPRQSEVPIHAGGGIQANAMKAAGHVLRMPGIASAMFVSLAVASALDVLIVYLPAYGDENGLSVATVGVLLAVRAGATLVSRAFMGPLTDRLGLGSTLLVTTGIAALSFALLPAATGIPMLFVLIALIGLGLGIGQPLTVAWIGVQSAPHERGLAFGVRHTGNLATLVVAPVAMGLIAGATTLNAIWWVLAVFLAMATVVAARTRFTPLHARD